MKSVIKNTNTRTLVCLSPKNRRKVVKCINKPMEDSERRGGEASNIEIHDSQKKESKRWSENADNQNQLYNRMKTMAYEEFCHTDFNREEYDSYSLVLYRTMLNELSYERRNLKYTTIFGDKWRKLSKENDNILYEYELNKIQNRINESIMRCEEFLEKEREFKKKYFKNENINFDNIIL